MDYVTIPLNAARRNPDKNAKLNIIKQLRPFYLKDEDNEKPKYFISFTKLPKLGVNPNFIYDNPLGIYAYPLSQMWLKIVNDKIPFAGDRPYVQVLKRTTNKILDSSYTWEDYPKDIKKLKDYVTKLNLKRSIDFKELQSECRANVRDKDSAVYSIWYFLYLLSKALSENGINRKHSFIWTTLLTKVLDYKCVIDIEGQGFIHPNEPKQALFLTKDSYQHVDMLLNKRYNDHSQHSKFMFDYEQIGYPSDFPEERIEIYEYITSLHPTLKNINGQSIITVYDKDKIKICSGNIFSNVKNIYFVGKDGQPKSISWNESPLPTTITGQKKYKIISCDLSNVVVNDCDIVRSIIRSGNFINCNFSKCKWINGTYNYDVFMFVNSKVSLEKLKKEYPEDKLTDLLYEMTIEQKGEELLGKKREDFTESDLKIIYKLAKKRLVAEIIDLSKLAEITKSDEVYYNK